MKKTILLLILSTICSAAFSQIKFDISRIKRIEVEKLVKTDSPNVVYLEMEYGGHELLKKSDIKKLQNRIVQKVQYVYTDYPKDFDYKDLVFERFASLYVLLPEVFNKPWIEWQIVKQTKCNSLNEAAKMFHGFVITFKDGPEPNAVTVIPPDIQRKIDLIDRTVDFADTITAKDLINFLSSKDIIVTDVKFPHKKGAIRLFRQRKVTSLKIVNGLLMTTGSLMGALGPNNSPSITSVNTYTITPDKNLLSIVGNKSLLFDAATVEFDVQINADSLVFRFAFASEEYPEFLQFNDVFGLFISGRGLNNISKDTTFNLATTPDGKTPVSVSSINHEKNTEYYIPNDLSDLELFANWQYDGFTKVFTARIKVKPNQKYHIKFAIADFADPYYDSAIFIDAFGVKTQVESPD